MYGFVGPTKDQIVVFQCAAVDGLVAVLVAAVAASNELYICESGDGKGRRSMKVIGIGRLEKAMFRTENSHASTRQPLRKE